ncbi:hypothetical protein PVT67_02885 [Gallaecimonas kandeliae]|uniref:hypothetical protein n=1 Tax=Gallaecimonas kandeliae TaxID=3029055 RepID=UPI0026485331|nr:hypothetical protein [Gallaecimonas kandeliae]WKE66208.1 hypothetical protein PVT67_02885 [Gallaecimonas kandeliae]
MSKGLKLIFSSIALFIAFSILLAFCLWYSFYDSAYVNSLLEKKASLIVIDSTTGYCVAAFLLFAPGLIFVPGNAYFKLKGRDDGKTANALNKLMVFACLLSLSSLFWGPWGVTHYWEVRAQKAGYQRCPSMTLLVNRLHYTAWAKDIYYCDDPDVVRILTRGSHQEIDEANQYIEKQARQ